MNNQKFRLNFVDVVLLLLIAAVALAAYSISRNSSAAVTSAPRTYVISFSEPDGPIAIGDAVSDSSRGYDMGTVVSVESDPDSGTVLVTVEAEAVESEKGVSTVSGCSIRTGTEVSCTIGSLNASGVIVKLAR